jgi:hypothetical protein
MDAVPTIKQVREDARRILEPMTIRFLKPNTYLSFARRMSNQSTARAKVGDWKSAAAAKRKEILNHELFREASKLAKQAQRDLKAVRRIGKESTLKVLRRAGPQYIGQVMAVLDRFEFRRISGPEAERRVSLREWLIEQEEAGRPLAVPDWLVDESRRQDFQTLTPSQLHDIRVFLEGIEHQARLKDKLIKVQRGRKVGVVAKEVAAGVRESRDPRKVIVGAETRGERAGELGAAVLAQGTKAGYWIRMFDGDRAGGPAQRALIRGLNEASADKFELQRDVMHELAGLYKEHFTTKELLTMNRREPFADAELMHEDRLSILGLMGSETGRQRLAQLLSPQQLNAVLASFTEADVAFVLGRWALFDRLFELAVEQHRRISGQKVEFVKRAELTITLADSGREVTLPGGYHPLDYKSRRRFVENLLEMSKALVTGKAPSAMMRLGFLKSRKEEVTGQVRLDRGVVVNHLLDVTHALTMREAVLDAQSILYHPEVQNAILDHYGRATFNSLDEWLKRVSADSGAAHHGLDKVLTWLRKGAVTSTLGFRLKSMLIQVFGFRQTIIMGGWENAFDALRYWFADAESIYKVPRLIDEKSKVMRQRTQGTWQRELTETQASVPTRLRTSSDLFAFYGLARVQKGADIHAWLTSYVGTWKEKPDDVSMADWEVEAVARADQFVKDTQSGGQQVDLSWWEGGPPLVRLLTTFFTETGLKFNQTRLIFSRTKWKDPGTYPRFLADIFLLYFLEAAVMSAIGAVLMKLEGDDEEEIRQKVTEDLVRRPIASMLDTNPVTRLFSGTALGYQMGLPSGLLVLTNIERAAKQIGQGELDAAFWKSVNLAAGGLLHYPAKQINELGEAIDQVFEGELPTALFGVRPD